MQTFIAEASVARGGDALDLNPRNGDRLFIGIIVSWETTAGDTTADSIAIKLANDIESYVKSKYQGVPNTRYFEGNLAYEEYNPIFANDAMYDQAPYKTYGGRSYAKLKSIQKKVDPNGFFPGRTGGFKFI